MKKNILYMGLIGLVGLLLAVCSDAGAGGPQDDTEPVTGPGIFSADHDLLGSTLKTYSNTDSGSPGQVTTSEVDDTLKIEFPTGFSGWGGAYIGNVANETPIDISDYENGKLVFSINYAGITNIGYLEIKVASKTDEASEVDDGGGSVDLFDYTATSSVDNWHTYEISLSDFNSIDSLDPAAMSSYFGVWNPKDSSGTLLTGSISIKEVYLDESPVSGGPPTPPEPVTGPGIFSAAHDLLGSTLDTHSNTGPGSSAPVTTSVVSDTLEIEFPTGFSDWGGAFIGNAAGETPIDISAYAGGKLVFSINYAGITNLDDLEIKVTSGDPESGGSSVNLFAYTATSSDANSGWHTYEIPLSDFSDDTLAISNQHYFGALDLTAMNSYFGVWNPKDNSGNLLTGSISIKEVYLDESPASGGAPTPAPLTEGGIYSETHTLLGSTEFGHGSSDGTTTVNSAQGAVTGGVSPADGSEMAQIDFQNSATDGGAFISSTATPIDISAYAGGKLVFSINYAGITNIGYLEIKVTSGTAEDGGGITNLFDYTATSSDANSGWHTYEIPLSDFNSSGRALDLDDMNSYFGMWSPRAASGDTNILDGSIYFDNVYLEPPTSSTP